ncbi:Eukaryotic translation initiation factor eIF2A family protein [Perilla frutescens var. hirtella]|uniref:Eukaryotic translation initiation factor 2A n=1 Tax=Perilla frutescens var. hirtella TaxID=608512 RepID=A0AAD4JHL6_PERFH|nr:Eukaryotic translation initiation factor eIF2A family protein [Perilla frutescens var. hirtella]
MAVANPPSLDILVRDSAGFTIWSGPPFSNGEPKIKLDKVPCNSTKFSDDGSKLMVIRSDSLISIYDSKNLAEISVLQVPNLLAASISPCGTYVQTFRKSASPQDKNVALWKAETGESVYQVFQKNMTKATWPSIRFSSDEAVACRLATNEVQFFDAGDFSKGFFHRLRVPGIAAFELSKTPGSYVAVFVPESKGMPANVQIFSCAKESQSQPVARKSFFRCSSVQLHWNHGSKGLLIVVQSDVDKTNQSYYGETKLNYLTTDGTYEGLVPLRKEGPVHDVQWSFSGKEFAAVYGFMPAMATIFDMKCNPLLELGTGPYNTVRWNPKGKFICLAGFGNLPGDMAFWDYLEKKKLGATKAELSVTSEWSPDGRYFMTATTAPRLQVDNGIKIFHHNGSLFFKRMFDKLFQVEWKPESPDKFGDIAEVLKFVDSLKLEDTPKQGQGPKSAQPNSKPAVSNPSAQKPAAYRPPHAKAAVAVQAELFGGRPTGELSKNALKNQKKREKQREKKAAEATSGASGT